MNSTVPPPKVKKNDPLLGSMVAGKFKILSLIAAGGMGKVYRAEQIPLGRTVALKVLHVHAPDAGDGDDPQFKKRFLREASILAKLQHPNIVTVFDYGAIEGESERYFMAMEFLSGQTLTRRISEKTLLPSRETIKIARQIARGLTEAHANGVIHRDLKPSNVMLLVGRDGEDLAKIVDFGIVKIINDDSQEQEELTQEGSFIGSPKYMAPEQITRGGKIDARTDIYSFGIILYQCLTGTVPFDGASSVQTLMAHLNQAPQPMRARVPDLDIPDWFEQLVMSCIEKDPERRPQTMDAVARTLTEAEAAMASGRSMAITGRSSSQFNPRSSSPDTLASSGSGPGAILSPSGSGRQHSITTQGTISSVVPGAALGDDKTRTSPGIKAGPLARRPTALIVGALAFLLVGGAALYAFLPHGQQQAPPSVQATPSPPPPPSASAPPPADQFALTIESIPTGAEVHEGDRVLGTTPLLITIENDSVRAGPRAFTVAKDGFQSYALAQGSSQTSVRLVAPLVASPAGTARATPTPRRPPPRTPPAAPPSAPSNQRPDLDIRLNR